MFDPLTLAIQLLSHLKINMEPTSPLHLSLMLHNKGQSRRLQQSLQDLQSGSSHTLMWPTIGGAPINEFTTEGYFSMAFPTLFPTGAADFLGQRCNQVTIGNYFTHLLKFEDGRFARHPRFRFFALNTEMRCVLYKLEESMSNNTQVMLSSQWMSCVIWWEERERLSLTEYSTMLQV